MNKKQLANYRKPEWSDFRKQVIELHNHYCCRCGRPEGDDVVLQVHHKYYNERLKPWEYPLAAVETLCKGCHAQEHGKVMPSDGWEYVGYDDLGDLCGECELCGTAIRYEHTICHPRWGELHVGCHCADKLTGTEEASEFDFSIKRKQITFEKFCESSNWNHIGNRYSQTFNQFKVTILKKANLFQIIIFIPLPETYDSLLDAQEAAFDICYNKSIKQFFEQHNLPYSEIDIKKPRSKTNPIIYKNILTFATDNNTGKLVHIDSVKPDLFCNCTCPACGQPLKAYNTSSNPHQFLHINNEPCEHTYEQMYHKLVLQLIEDEKTLFLPQFENSQVELYVPSEKIPVTEFESSTKPIDTIVTYTLAGEQRQLGVIISLAQIADSDIGKGIIFKYPIIEIKLLQQFISNQSLKLKELKEILASNDKIYSWYYAPQYDLQIQTLTCKQLTYLYDYAGCKKNHTENGLQKFLKYLHYYFITRRKQYGIEEAKSKQLQIKQNIHDRFYDKSIFSDKTNGVKLCEQQKYGIEEYFLLFLFTSIHRFSWNHKRKEKMYSQLTAEHNLPIFEAIGSLWFGHIFNRFLTDDFQTFIYTIVSSYPEASCWVLKYLEKNIHYRNYCEKLNIDLTALKKEEGKLKNIWIDGIFYSALPDIFPRVTLPYVLNAN